ncbi:MAG: hypothetical protein LBQ61_00940 [Spirochaetales bacterium]|jgi:hypothetical protein|nr:hypothetical protein [Spirochaetales bacterium]
MKKKDLLRRGYLLFIFCLSLRAFAQAPLWLTDRSLDFPDSRFISALGRGNTAEEARNMALSELSLFFGTTVEVITEQIFTLNQSNSSVARNLSMNENLRVSSQEEFLGVRFTSPYYDPASRTYSVAGYINREEARQIYRTRIEGGLLSLEALAGAAEGEPEPLRKLSLLRQAAALGQLLESDAAGLARFGDSAAALAPVTEAARRARASADALRLGLAFEVVITGGDREGRIQRKLMGLLEAAGYLAVRENPAYRITGGITAAEESLPAGYFVRPAIALELRPAAGGGALFSYTRNYSRRGSRVSWDAARTAAIRAIEEDLEQNFINAFHASLGG